MKRVDGAAALVVAADGDRDGGEAEGVAGKRGREHDQGLARLLVGVDPGDHAGDRADGHGDAGEEEAERELLIAARPRHQRRRQRRGAERALDLLVGDAAIAEPPACRRRGGGSSARR